MCPRAEHDAVKGLRSDSAWHKHQPCGPVGQTGLGLIVVGALSGGGFGMLAYVAGPPGREGILIPGWVRWTYLTLAWIGVGIIPLGVGLLVYTIA